jgi:D-beta-D-heptose 7-phosphate kinase/D-beta-D-heptose 1-phosphate adenosyltransferase
MRNNRGDSFSAIKIKSLHELKNIVLRLKAAGKTVVFTNGCFDLLHYGHINYLEAAKAQGDALIVALNTDASIRKIKGKLRPLVILADREKVIAALACVDYVVSFNEKTPLKIIENLKPDILVKGADWKKEAIVGAEIVKKCGGKVVTIELVKGRSTSNLIKKIVRVYQ